MVTTQELEQRERELSAIEEEARRRASQKVPQRRFGSSVTKEQQQEVIRQQQQAAETLKQVSQERQQIEQAKGQLAEQAQYENDLKIARKAAGRGKVPKGASKRVIELYEALRENRDLRISRTRQFSETYKKQGLEPIFVKGKLVGFSDTKRGQTIPVESVGAIASSSYKERARYEAIGVTFESQAPAQPTAREQAEQRSLPPTERFKPSFAQIVSQQSEQDGLDNNTGSVGNADNVRGDTNNSQVLIQQSQGVVEPARQPETYLERLEVDVNARRFQTSRGTKPKTINEAINDFLDKKSDIYFESQRAASGYIYRLGILPAKTITSIVLSNPTIPNVAENNRANINTLKAIGKSIELFTKSTVEQRQKLLIIPYGFALKKGLEIGQIARTEPSYFIGSLAGEASLQLALSKGVTATVKYANKPYVIREAKVETKFFSRPNVYTIKQGETVTTAAEFFLAGVKPQRQAITLTRFQFQLAKAQGLVPKGAKSIQELRQLVKAGEVTIPELKIAFPSAPVSVDPAKIAVSTLPLTKAEDGNIVGFISTVKSSAKRTSGLTKSGFAGTLAKQEKPLRLIKRENLDATVRRSLEEIETRMKINNNVVAKYDFSKEATLETGEVITQDIIKFNADLNKAVGKVVPVGKRTTRGSLTIVQDTKSTIEFEKQYGLKEIEFIKERIGVTDVTLPTPIKLTKPRKVSTIISEAKVIFIELPEVREPTKFIKGIAPKLTAEQSLARLSQSQQTQKVLSEINKGIGSSALKQEKLLSRGTRASLPTPEQTRIAKLPLIVGGAGVSISRFTGGVMGDELVFERPMIQTRPKDFEIFKPTTLEISAGSIREIERLQNRNINRSIAREVQRPISNEVTREINRQVNRQTTRQTTRQVTRQLNRQTTGTKLTPIKITTRLPRGNFKAIKLKAINKNKMKSVVGPAFRTYIIRRGRKVYLSGILPRGRALKKGEVVAKTSLAATFGIEPLKIRIKAKDITYKPSSKFRGFKISRGRRIPLNDKFIQKANQRLSSGLEVREIQVARKNRL